MNPHSRPYFLQFIDAVKYHSEREGLSVLAEELARNMTLTIDECRRIRSLIASHLHPFSESYVQSCAERGPVEHSCHAISHGFAEALQQLDIGAHLPVAITIGNIFFNGQDIYNTNREKIRIILRNGFDKSKTIDLHVWITLSDMTVVDLSIYSTLAAFGLIKPKSQMDDRVLIWREEVESQFYYEPILVDNNFFSKVERGIVVRNGA